MQGSGGDAPEQMTSGTLTTQQIAFFETFGFIRLEGLVADDIPRIEAGFEAVFADESIGRWTTNKDLHFGRTRVIVPAVVSHHDDLSWLQHDPRILGVVESLVGPRWEYAESDGNILSCDTSWHNDVYGAVADLMHLKLLFYLDPIDASCGGLRLLPGSHDNDSSFSAMLVENLVSLDPARIPERLGVAPDDVPSVAVDTRPGDVIALNFRTLHAAFGSGERRRLFTMNYRAVAD